MTLQKLISKILINIAYLLLLFIGKSSRKIFINYRIREKFEKEKTPVIYSLWHNRVLYIVYLYRKQDGAAMISQHKDGNYVAKIMRKFRFTPIRGSSTRGGINALEEMIEYITEQRCDIAFTPDGPRGPKYTIQDGVLLTALKTGFPIVPICWNAKRKIVFNSWDNFILPLPHNKFVVAYGTPIYVRSRGEIEKKSKELHKAMMNTVNIADNYKF